MVKKYKFKFKRSWGKALSTRGGFSISTGDRTGGRIAGSAKRARIQAKKRLTRSFGRKNASYSMKPSTNPNRAVGAMIAGGALKSPAPAIFVAGKLAALAYDKVMVKVNGTTYKKAEDAPAKGLDRETVAAHNTIERGVRSAGSEIGKEYFTKFTAGQPPTRSVLAYARLNGTQKFTHYDTEVDNQDTRGFLETTTGFNQKAITWYGPVSYWSFKDLRELTDVNSALGQNMGFSNVYWLTQCFSVKYRIINKNPIVPMYVRVKFLRQMEPNGAFETKIDNCFNANDGIQEIAKVPVSEQFGVVGYQGANDSTQSKVALDPVLGSISRSARFDTAFNTIQTFSKKLEPGEIWTITYDHWTGSGINLGNLVATNENIVSWADKAAAFYAPIFEVWGDKVNCYSFDSPGNHWIGTSSGAVQMDMMKSCKINSRSADIGNVYDPVEGFLNDRWAYKVYQERGAQDKDNAVQKRFNVNYSSIAKNGQPGAGLYIIPVSSEVSVMRGGKESEVN